MRRQPNRVKKGAVVDFCRDAIKADNKVRSSFRPSQTGEEHPLGPLKTAMEVSNGSSVANPIISGTFDYDTTAFQADELSMKTAMPAAEFSRGTETQVESPAAVVDEGLIDQPTPRRTNPTTVILPKIYMEYAIEYQETVLYEKEKGQWVAEPLPEKTAEKVASTVTT